MSNILNTLAKKILGVDSGDTDRSIDQSLQNISMYTSAGNNDVLADMMKKAAIASTGDNSSFVSALNTGVPQVQTYDTTGRISRYNEYESVVTKIPYCKRALETLTDHIISPDDITKSTLEFTKSGETKTPTEQVEIAITRLKDICNHFKFEDKIKDIIKTTLKKGDNFVEIVSTKNGKNQLVVLNEASDAFIDNIKQTDDKPVILSQRSITCNYITEGSEKKEFKKFKLICDSLDQITFGGVLSYMKPSVQNPISPILGGSVPGISSSQFNSKFDSDSDKSNVEVTPAPADETNSLSTLSLVCHDPRYVIKLETKRFKVCLGYLVFPKVDLLAATGSSFSANDVDNLCYTLLGDIQKKLNSSDSIKISDDMKNIISKHLNKIQRNEDLKIRYVSPDMMQHWKINVDKYDPYGESIFDSVMYDCKLLMALKTANTIKGINSCTDKRFINVEVGLPRDANNLVKSIQEAFNKRKISVDGMGSINSIPSQISTLETVYIPMKDGKKYVEIDEQKWGTDIAQGAEQLKYIRDGIVGNLGVPAAYLGIEDGVGNRSILTTESINFCRTIISFQKELSIPLNEIYYKIYCVVYGKKEANILSKVNINFQSPKISPYEHQMEYLEQAQRAIDVLSALGCSKDFLKKKYLPNIDWDAAQDSITSDRIDSELGDTTDPAADDMMGLGGMGMGMGGGVPPMGGVPAPGMV